MVKFNDYVSFVCIELVWWRREESPVESHLQWRIAARASEVFKISYFFSLVVFRADPRQPESPEQYSAPGK